MKRIYKKNNNKKKETTPKLNSFFFFKKSIFVCKSRYIETKNKEKLKGVDLKKKKKRL